jgi:cyanophycin synthetase
MRCRIRGSFRVESAADNDLAEADLRRPVTTCQRRCMKILETQVYRGANYWAPVPAIRFVLDIRDLSIWRAKVIPEFCETLSTTLPTLSEHSCEAGPPGGFFEQVREGASLLHVAEHVALELQILAGQTVSYGRVHAANGAEDQTRPGISHIVFQYQEAEVGIAAGELAIRVLESLACPQLDRNFDFATQLNGLILLAKELRLGIDTRMLRAEAESRGIPVEYLDKNRGGVRAGHGTRRRLSLMQLGHGRFQKRIWAPYVSTDSFIAAEIASNKQLTNSLLRDSGLPVPQAISVADVDSAAAAAREIGYPVVVKPLDGSQGRGVGVYLQDDDAVRAHFPLALRETHSGTVLVEKFISGRHYRILVVGGRFVAAAERLPAHVTGDGMHTLRQLVELSNADPTRGVKHKTRIAFDDRAIALAQEQGFGPEDVPPFGERVPLVRTCNISTGGISIDCTDEIHPYNVAIAEQATQIVGLDVAGIDLIAPNIAQSVLETGGAISEVNGGPGLFVVHSQPTEGKPRNVTRAVIDHLFPSGAPSRVPIIAITGANGTAVTSRLIAKILTVAGRRVGVATSEGMDISGRRIVRGDMSGSESPPMLLRNPAIDAAVLEIGHKGILCSGLGYDRADVAVITNVSGEHMGRAGINALQQLARLNAVVANSTSERGVVVLNADDDWCVRIAGEAHGEVIYFSLHPDNEAITRHLRAGGRALIARPGPDGEVVFLIEGADTSIVLAPEISASRNERAAGNISNALAAAAACVGLGINSEFICQGLRSFVED